MPVWVYPGRKPRRHVSSWRGSLIQELKSVKANVGFENSLNSTKKERVEIDKVCHKMFGTVWLEDDIACCNATFWYGNVLRLVNRFAIISQWVLMMLCNSIQMITIKLCYSKQKTAKQTLWPQVTVTCKRISCFVTSLQRQQLYCVNWLQ